MSLICRKGEEYTMKLSRLTLLIVAVLLLTTPTPAQRKGTRRSTNRPPQEKPAQEPPQKSEEELLIEKEVATLSALPPEKKETLRKTIKALNRTLEELQLRGYDRYFFTRKESEEMASLLDEMNEGVPDSMLTKLLNSSWRAMSDSQSAARIYYEDSLDTQSGASEMLDIMRRYQLGGTSARLMGGKVLERGAETFGLALALSHRAGIITVSMR